MASSTMEKQDHQQNQAAQAAAAGAAALRCPRCDSANTKFCYYNNYSLSQPRHFCKACKRYWTRGGTLRNVPVGGGCRKNKRLKRPSINNPPPIPTSSALENPSHRRQFQIIDQINNNNPLFYNKQQPYDQLSSFALAAAANNNSSSSPPPASNGGFGYPASNLFGSNNNNSGEAGEAILSPTMATLLASTLNNKFSSSSSGVVKRPADSSSVDHHNHFQAMAAFDGLQMSSGVLKNEQQQQGQEWNFNAFTSNGHNYSGGQHQVAAAEQIGSDPQSVYWNALWHDPGNIGPSVTSLI